MTRRPPSLYRCVFRGVAGCEGGSVGCGKGVM